MTAQSAGLVAKLETIARQLDWWIEFGERSFESEGKMFTDDMVHSPPELPSKGVLKAWIATINEAALLAALPQQPAGEAVVLTLGQRAVARELLICCESWEPNVCVMGNVRAKDAADLLRFVLATPPQPSVQQEAQGGGGDQEDLCHV